MNFVDKIAARNFGWEGTPDSMLVALENMSRLAKSLRESAKYGEGRSREQTLEDAERLEATIGRLASDHASGEASESA